MADSQNELPHHHDPTLDPRTCGRLDRLEAAVAALQGNLPAEGAEIISLPRFLGASPSVASEMQARLEDFDKRAAEVLETARQNIEASRSGEARFAKLEQQIADLGRDLRREMATAMRTIGGGT
jgi:hypothetical protein